MAEVCKSGESEGYVGFEITSRRDGGAKVRMTLPPGLAEKLSPFLRDRGFFINEAIPVLIEYGLTSPSEDVLNELESERERELPRLEINYATTRFKAYQCFMINQAIVMRLHILLSENCRLKKLCKARGVKSKVTKDPWDTWGPNEVDSFYKRYVFVNSV